jgi:ClpP class serine protease
MKYQRIIEQIYFRPWYITSGGHKAVRQLIQSKLFANEGADMSMIVNQREEMEVTPDGIAIIHVCGTLGKGLSPIEKSCGSSDYEDIADEIEDAVEMGVRGLMLEISSPGGTVVGNHEIAELVQTLQIPTLAYSDDLACSAAYNIAASCRTIVGSPSSTWGSIGCIIPWQDESIMWEIEGKRFDPITNSEGDLKSAMHGPSLTPDQRVSLEQYVQDAFEMFRGNVLRNRTIPDDAMRGQSFFAPRALQNNLIDAIVQSEDDAYQMLLQKL